MLKKLASSLILGSLLASSAFAGDFLAKVSNGALSDNSQGVKALNLDEMKQVKGGAFQSEYVCYTSQCYGFANNQTITGTHVKDWRAVTLETVDPSQSSLFVGFMSQNNWAVNGSGQRYNYFTYAAVILDGISGQIYKQSSAVLNNNGIVRELSYRYKDQFDRYFGGLQIIGKRK
ncbi:hypothetical protein C3H44_08950 [Campylobacter jejuni]|uniref:hypothetical protein n=2 Tax=Campylobacter jejuni TaxID=197 RepID=UPI000F80E19C|nr:hypothetical protein [Campylobacter jejuni]RTJ22947.1 hypothetical protein C3H82_09080 [Campylobacter jejuni]RTJ91777.1 hypothetical protein C3H44_08950 [Campylobacter jejuni]RTK09791.1 hypothetical protein C3H35_08980 [Campylobacter jejuni]